MSEKIPTRDEALTLLKKYNKTESLIKHALAVEGVMRYFARKRNEDEDKWGIIGLVHDLDYEQFPDQHCKKTEEILIHECKVEAETYLIEKTIVEKIAEVEGITVADEEKDFYNQILYTKVIDFLLDSNTISVEN